MNQPKSMNSNSESLFAVNGVNYDRNKLSTEGQKILSQITDAQTEVARLEKQKSLLDAAQKHLISKLKPHLPPAIHNQEAPKEEILGHASDVIPSTPSNKPEEEISPFPSNIPSEFKP